MTTQHYHEARILAELKKSPKTWRDLTIHLPRNEWDASNLALMHLEERGEIYLLAMDGCYRLGPRP